MAWEWQQEGQPARGGPAPRRLYGTLADRSSPRRLRAVLRTPLLPIPNTLGIQSAPHYMIANARQVFHSSASNKNNGVLLQIVTFARDVRRYLHPVGKPDAGDLPHRGVGLLGRRGAHIDAHAALLRRAPAAPHLAAQRVQLQPERRRGALFAELFTALAYELIDRRHLPALRTVV